MNIFSCQLKIRKTIDNDRVINMERTIDNDRVINMERTIAQSFNSVIFVYIIR